MAKRAGIAALLGMAVAATSASGADYEIHPSLALNQEYTDNVFETGTNRVADFITRVLPGISMSYQAPSLKGDLSYTFDYRHYARGHRKDEITHTLGAKGYLIAIKDLLFLDVVDDYQRASLNVTRDLASESLFLDQSDRNIVTAFPYILLHPTARTDLKTGYRFTDTRYFDSPAISKMDHAGVIELSHALTEQLKLTSGYTFTRELADQNNFSQHQAVGGFRYEYADKSYLFAQGGYTWTNYSNGQRFQSIFWNGGITQVIDSVTATVTTGRHYVEDPLRSIMQETYVSGSLEKRFSKGMVSIAPVYSEYKTPGAGSIDTRKYGASVRGQYQIAEDLSGEASFAAEKYEQPQLASYTRRFVTHAGLRWLLAKQLTLSLAYYYVDYYSPGIATDNRHVNRGMIEIKKVF